MIGPILWVSGDHHDPRAYELQEAMRLTGQGRLRVYVVQMGLVSAALCTATCSDPTLPSKTTIIPPPSIMCPTPPAPITVVNGQSAIVTYAVPTVAGGTAPLSVSCAPPSGSAFAMGSTPITCIATDAVRRTASCSFSVSVVPPVPRLGITTILAFGDSITEGEVPVVGEFPALSIRPRYVELPKSYPADLTVLLASRYSAQGATRIDALTLGSDNTTNCWTDPPAPATSGIVVINAGCLGEQAAAPSTLARLNDKIAAYHPDLVLLLEGTNDLNPSSPSTSIANGVNGIQTLARAIRSHGTPVMVGTLLPQIASDLTHGGAPDLVIPFNTQLVPAAIGAGARVVDLYSDIASDVTDWISPYDGLHPTEQGYAETARVWFNAIQSTFELPSSSAPASVHALRPCGTAHGSPCKR